MNKKGAQMEDFRDDEDWYTKVVLPEIYAAPLGGGTE